MYDINIAEKYSLSQKDGMQQKYFYKNNYYKLDNGGHEGIVEELTSLILSCSTLKPSEYTTYECCKINGQYGCRSENFLKDNEEFISLNKLHKDITGQELMSSIRTMPMQEKINYVVNFVKENTGLDITDYLRKCITLDYITRNPDRHFRNLGIKQYDKTFSIAPIFDNGQGLMAYMEIPSRQSITDALDELSYNPFSDDINEMYNYFGPGFQVDFNQLENLLLQYDINSDEYGYKELKILKHQIEKLKNTELNITISLDDMIKENTISDAINEKSTLREEKDFQVL